MHVKICGLTTRKDADLSADLGADYLGCVLVPGTPRYVDADEARRILHGHPGDVTGVLVFRNPSHEDVLDAIRRSGLIHVQLHDVSDELADALLRSGIGVHRVYEPSAMKEVPSDREALIHHIDVGGGGSGTSFDWAATLAPCAPERTFIAGGLTPENLPELLRYQPFGIDASSGLESEPGIKSPTKLKRFLEIANNHRRRAQAS